MIRLNRSLAEIHEKWEAQYEDWQLVKQESQGNWQEWENKLLEKFHAWQEQQKAIRGLDIEVVPEDVQRRNLRRLVREIPDIPDWAHVELVERFLDDMYRMGPLQPLWSDPDVSDIQVFVPIDPEYEQIITYVRRGKRMRYDGPGFRDYTHARLWINRHISRFGLRYDPAKVQLDASAPDGERIHIISGASGYSTFKDGKYRLVPALIISIRRFVAAFTLEDLAPSTLERIEDPDVIAAAQTPPQKEFRRRPVAFRAAKGAMMDPATRDFLTIMVRLGKNHIVSGGTGVGKTTMANALTAAIPEDQVLLILEESPEMQPQRAANTIRVYERRDTLGNTVFSIADGLKAALRMFPDRIFVSEIRDALAVVWLQAIQSGHDGSSTTVHASSCTAAVERVIDLATTHPSRPSREVIRSILFDRLDTVIHGQRIGSWRFFDEVVQLKPDGTIHTVMKFVQDGVNEDGSPTGYWIFYGPTDAFVEEMLRHGISIPPSWGWGETPAPAEEKPKRPPKIRAKELI